MLGFLASCSPQGRLLGTHPGPEDLTLARVDGRRLLVTGTASRLGLFSKAEGEGRIEILDLDGAQDRFRVIHERPAADTEKYGPGFGPAGLHTIADPRDPARLLLYSTSSSRRRPKQGRVAVFHLSADRVSDAGIDIPPSPYLPSINGLTVARDGTIYATNFSLLTWRAGAPRAGSVPLKRNGAAPGSTVVMMKPVAHGGDGRWRIAAHHFSGANGLALSPDERHLLVCSYYSRKLHAFRRELDGSLAADPVTVARFPHYLDNLKSLGNDEYAVAGQTSVPGFILHLITKRNTARGGGERFRWTPEAGYQLLADYGPWLRMDGAAPSTALPVDGKLYVGHVGTPGVRVFPVP